MRQPVIIHIPQCYEVQTKYVQTSRLPPEFSGFKLPYAQEIELIKHSEFSIVLQYYDARDIFLCVVEIRAQEAFHLHLKTVLPDIYWVFDIKGTYQLHPYGRLGQDIIHLKNNQYTIAYTPPQWLSCSFVPGIHRYIYFSVSKACLHRNENHGPNLFKQLLEKQEQTFMSHHTLPAFTLDKKFDNALKALMQLAKPAINDLLFESQLALSIGKIIQLTKANLSSSSGEDRSSYQLALELRQYLEENISKGRTTSVNELSYYFETSRQRLNRIHQNHFGSDLRSYITQLRMEKAKSLLEDGLKPSDVWIKVGYQDIFSFSKAFKKYYNVAPSNAAKSATALI
ncbi:MULTISPECIES: helix-turn-helix domain-containing protein [Olivibacter]|uniref:Helix-turn-helix domain-containing protein n=1 Tax=Olivibacter jilunii TaxID=985016 RepID=A0ABW6B2P7_9SPHI